MTDKLEHLLEDYKKGTLASQRGVVRMFGLLIQSNQIESLGAAYKRVAEDLIHDGLLTESGMVIDQGR